MVNIRLVGPTVLSFQLRIIVPILVACLNVLVVRLSFRLVVEVEESLPSLLVRILVRQLVGIYYPQCLRKRVFPSLWILLLNHLRRSVSLLLHDSGHLVETHDFLATEHGPIFFVGENVDVVEVAVGIVEAFLNELLFLGSRVIRAAVLYLAHLTLLRI